MSRPRISSFSFRKAGEHVEQYRRRLHLAEGERIRSHIEVWARSLPSEITWPELPTEIQDRDADVWEALIAVADLVGGMWSERARQAAIMLLAANREDKGNLGIKLLADLRLVFGDAEAKPTAAILEALRGIDESPWGDLKGKPLDDRGLARRLRQYGVKSDVIWFGNRQARGYHRAALADQWQRYLPPSPDMDVTSVTSVRPTTVTPVTPVTLSSGQGDRTCAQCNAPGGPLSILKNGGDLVYLHPECVRFWRADNLDIPDCLRRQAGSGL